MIKTAPVSPEERALRQRITQNSADMESCRKLARIYAFEGKAQEAAELYARVVQAKQNDAEALNFLAHFYLEREGFDHAYTLFSAILSSQPNNKAARYQLNALQAYMMRGKTAPKFAQLFERMIQPEDRSSSLGLRRENIPCLIEMNGDLIWMPGDLLRFLWHTVQKPMISFVPSFFAETHHYVWVKEKLSAGDTVLDIGTNIGIFATMMAAKVGPKGRVFAFEPSPRIAADLRRVLALNEFSQVTVIEAAASDQKGEATFKDVQEQDVRRESSHLEHASIDRPLDGLQQSAVKVKTMVVDELVEDERLRPSLIKIDVEGAEFLVLAGLSHTLDTFKPKLVIEFHPDSTGFFDHAKLTALLKTYQYQLKVEDKTYYCW